MFNIKFILNVANGCLKCGYVPYLTAFLERILISINGIVWFRFGCGRFVISFHLLFVERYSSSYNPIISLRLSAVFLVNVCHKVIYTEKLLHHQGEENIYRLWVTEITLP